MSPSTASQAVFDADLARIGGAIERSGAVVTLSDGWQGIDPERCPPALLSAYQRLLQYGYANGLMP
jgi:hypothetical protein